MYEVSWHFIHSFTSYSCLNDTTFAFVLYITITHRHTRPWKRWPNWTNYDSNWLLTHRFLQTWPLATIICSQTSSDGSRERDSDWMRKLSRKPRRISKERNAWTFRTTERASKYWKIAILSVSPSKATMLRNKYNFLLKKRLFSLKIPGLFSPCSIRKIQSPAC